MRTNQVLGYRFAGDRRRASTARLLLAALLVGLLVVPTAAAQRPERALAFGSGLFAGDVELEGCTPGETLRLRGFVTQQGHAAPTGSVHVRMDRSVGGFYKEGDYPVQAGGYFAIVVNPGTYRICVKGPHSLQVCKYNVVLDCPGVGCNCDADVDFGVLREGDANGDNKVDAIDASILATYYWGSDPRADFNDDGIINALDASLLATNYWQTGQSLLGDASGGESRTVLTERFADILLSPQTAQMHVGDVVTFTVQLDAGDRAIQATDVFLQYDPALLRVVDAVGQEATAVIPVTDELDIVVRNFVQPAEGIVAYAAWASQDYTPVGPIEVFRLPVEVLAPTGPSGTDIAFLFDQQTHRVTLLAITGQDVLRDAAGSHLVTLDMQRLLIPQVYSR